MRIIHLKRGILWLVLLIYTLIKFWIKHPQETPVILGFITRNTIALIKFFYRNIFIEKHRNGLKESVFFYRNIFIEKHRNGLKELLTQTIKLYKFYGKAFDPVNPNSYRKLEEIISNRVQLLYFLIRKLKPIIVVETGVAAGESTGYILQALNDNNIGTLYSIDLPLQWYIYGKNRTLHLDSLPTGEISGYLIPKHLKNRWQLIIGSTYDRLPELLEQLGKVDIFFHDSEHTEKTMTFEYQISWPYIKRRGFLISDDIAYTNAFNKFSKKLKAKTFYFKSLGLIKK